MEITDRAKAALTGQDVFAIRLYFDGISCRKTRIGLHFGSLEDDDEVLEMDGIQIAIDPMIEAEAEIVILDFDGENFIFLGLEKDLS